MINHISQNENTKNDFSKAIKELQIGKLLRRSNISKNCGISAFEVFQFLLLLVFREKICSVSLIQNIRNRLFQRTPIIVSLMKHPIIGANFCYSLLLR